MNQSESQIKRMLKEMKKGKVKNWEFAKMGILSYTKRISEIRERGISVSKERLYDREGKATGTFVYWLPKQTKADKSIDGMFYERVDG